MKKLILIFGLLVPFTIALANGDSYGNGSIPNNNYTPTIYKSYSSGPYVGVGGSALYIYDKHRYQGTSFPPGNIKQSVEKWSAKGGGFIGYGEVLTNTYLQYLALQLNYNYYAIYSKDGIHGVTINPTHEINLNIKPGHFFDDDKTWLIYGILGAGGNIFEFHGARQDQNKTVLVVRGGGGIEHEITNNFYIRGEYVYSQPLDKITFKINARNDQYSSYPQFQAITLGFSYRIPITKCLGGGYG